MRALSGPEQPCQLQPDAVLSSATSSHDATKKDGRPDK
jgi:hypothetical protein